MGYSQCHMISTRPSWLEAQEERSVSWSHGKRWVLGRMGNCEKSRVFQAGSKLGAKALRDSTVCGLFREYLRNQLAAEACVEAWWQARLERSADARLWCTGHLYHVYLPGSCTPGMKRTLWHTHCLDAPSGPGKCCPSCKECCLLSAHN